MEHHLPGSLSNRDFFSNHPTPISTELVIVRLGSLLRLVAYNLEAIGIATRRHPLDVETP